MIKHKGVKKTEFRSVLFLFILMSFLSFFSFNVYATVTTIDEAKSIIKNYYVDNISDKVLDQTNISDMVAMLNDPYSSYFTKEEMNNFVNGINMKFSGIGINIEPVKEGLRITSTIDGAPAELAGLKEGDIIISVDDYKLEGLSAEKASSYIKGKDGTIVKLQVERNSSILNFSVERKIISMPTVIDRVIDGHIGYIYIESFGENTANEFKQCFDNLDKPNIDRLIVDLRNNPGGYMATALDIAGYFIGDNNALIVQGRDGQRGNYKAVSHGDIIKRPIICLINEYSASASEILAAALKDYGKVFFVGNTTYGKGVAQNMFPLSDGSFIKLTTTRFYSPLGKIIQKIGISPDFEVKSTQNSNVNDGATIGIDSLAVAVLLSGNLVSNTDKTGYIKINIGGRDFQIDLKKAQQKGLWTTFKYILDNVSRGNIYLGNKNGWTLVNNTDNIYYPQYVSMPELNGVDEEKSFNILFSKNVNIDSINDDNIQLITEKNAEKVLVKFSILSGNKVMVTPVNPLVSGESYNLIISDKIKGSENEFMKQGVVTHITVR